MDTELISLPMDKPLYLFTSLRLGFRNWNTGDLEAFAQMNADPEVMRYFPSALTRDQSKKFMKRLQQHFEDHGYTYYAVDCMKTREWIGFIGLTYQTYEAPFTPATDVGWRLKKSAWNRGFATEGAQRCIQYAFAELGLEEMVAVCPVGNRASENVMQKIGMTHSGTFDHSLLVNYPNLQKCCWYTIN